MYGSVGHPRQTPFTRLDPLFNPPYNLLSPSRVGGALRALQNLSDIMEVLTPRDIEKQAQHASPLSSSRISTGSAARIDAPTKDVDTGIKTENDHVGYEEVSWWQRVPFLDRHASPPTGTIDDAPLSGEASAGFFSQLYWTWLTPIMVRLVMHAREYGQIPNRLYRS